ncbi:hypothetical protein [Metabacillus litoralis]|uniref:hypothetical protein n=1 Tax=Metabacillus litoralis TaxID=152268 RepID=UPI001CFEAF85|nr:hypothetical protein [Metabacillus litoralis]
MSTKNQWLLNIGVVLVSFLTLPALGLRNLKRFLPASILILLIEMLHQRYGKKQRWWVFYNKPNSSLFGEFPFQLGPFLMVALWTLKLAYGNFNRFILLNSLAHAFIAFPFSFLAKKLKYYSLVRMNNLQFFLYFLSKAPILYVFQTLFLKIRRN